MQQIDQHRGAPRVAIGATVRTIDGQEVGKVDRFIVDPYTHAIRALVIRKGFMLRNAVEVPISAIIGGTQHEVRLRLTADQVRNLPEFVDARYAAPPTGFVPPAEYALDTLLWPLGVPLLPPPPPRRDETAVRFDLNNAQISQGSDVISRDDQKIGEVRAVTVDPRTGQPLTFVVRRGFLFTRDVEFPADVIRDVDSGVVFIDLDAKQARAYAQSVAARRGDLAQSPETG